MRNPIPETPWVISLRIQREKKGDYTQAARKRGMKLLPWIIEQCDEAVEKGNMTTETTEIKTNKYAVRSVDNANCLGIIRAESLEEATALAAEKFDYDPQDLIVLENPLGEGRMHIGKNY
jgi:hypothetical protein